MHYDTRQINFWEVSLVLLNFMWPFLPPNASDSCEVYLICVHHSCNKIPSSSVSFNIRSAHPALIYRSVTADFMNNPKFESTQFFVPLCKTLWNTILGTRSCKLWWAVTNLTRQPYPILMFAVGQLFGACPHFYLPYLAVPEGLADRRICSIRTVEIVLQCYDEFALCHPNDTQCFVFYVCEVYCCSEWSMRKQICTWVLKNSLSW